MDKTACYKCDIEPSVYCGECPLWLGDEEASDNERIAYKQGKSDALREFAEWFKTSNFYLCFSDTIDDVIAEYERVKKNEM